MSENADTITPDMEAIEACEGILAVLGASQRQLRFLIHQHMSFAQVLAVEEDIRVGGSPERAEIQRFRMLLDARLDHVRQLRTMVSAAPLVETFDSNNETAARLKEALSTVERPRVSYNFTPNAADILTEVPVARTLEGLDTGPSVAPPEDPIDLPEISAELEREVTIESSFLPDTTAHVPENNSAVEMLDIPQENSMDTLDLPDSIEFEMFEDDPTVESETYTTPNNDTLSEESKVFKMPQTAEAKLITPLVLALGGDSNKLSNVPESELTEPPTQETPAPLEQEDESVFEPTFEAAISAYKRGDTARAADIYTALIEGNSSNPPLLLARGRCYLDLGDWSSSMSDFRKAESLAPESPDPLVAMGDLFLARHDYERAIQRFDSAIELDDAHAIARSRRGVSHYYTHSYRQAFLDLQRAYHLDPELPNIRQLVQMAIRKIEDIP